MPTNLQKGIEKKNKKKNNWELRKSTETLKLILINDPNYMITRI